MRTLLYLARHGTTEDSGKDFFRGQRDTPLDKKGFVDAHELKEFFAGKKWHLIFSSDMTRGIQTAKVIAGERTDEIMLPVRGLRPWNIGYLTGKAKEQYGADMQAFIDNPEETPQDGESRNHFEHERVHPLLIEAMKMGTENAPPIIIGHSSIVHSLCHLLYGESHKDIAVKPGGVIEVYLDSDEIKARPVLKSGHDDSSFSAKKESQSS